MKCCHFPKASLVVEHRIVGVDFLVLPCLASGINSNLASYSMVYLRHHGIAVDDENGPDPKNISYHIIHPLNALNLKPEEIIFSRQSKHLHCTYARYKNIIMRT